MKMKSDSAGGSCAPGLHRVRRGPARQSGAGAARRAALGTLLLALTGCSALSRSWNRVFGAAQLRTVDLVAAGDANHDTAVAVDLVLIEREATLATLSKIRSADWFANREDWRREYQQQIRVVSWEIPPDTRLEVPLGRAADAYVGYLVFANYPGDRPFRAQFRDVRQITVILKKDDFDAIAG